MKLRSTTLLSLLLINFLALAQNVEPCKCCTETHKQFDFWIGQWTVVDTTGKHLGTNRVEKIQDGCAMQENWKSAGITGTSYNYFNTTDNTWNQVWVDNKGGNLVLKGKWNGESMIMKSQLLPGKKIDSYFNQITWTPNSDGTVTQEWDMLDSQSNSVVKVFHGIYRPAKK